MKAKKATAMPRKPTVAESILADGIATMIDREATYDKAATGGERSMAKTVALFNVLHGTNLTEVQGWQFMQLLKLSRSTQGAYKHDNFVDGAAYAGLAGEAARAATMVGVEKEVAP